MLTASVAGAAGNDIKNMQILPFYERSDRASLQAVINRAASQQDVAIAWFGMAGLQVDGAAHKAVELLSALPQTQNDSVMKARLGSAYIMKARDQSFVPARVISVRKGLRILEAAAKAAPDNYDIRVMRAATTLNLPDIFDYRDQTRRDLEFLIARVEAGSAPVRRGDLREGRMIAALGKVCIQQKDKGCAQRQVDLLMANYSDSSELKEAVLRLNAAMPD